MLVFAGVMLACCGLLVKRSASSQARGTVEVPQSIYFFAVLPVAALLQWLLGQLPYGGDVVVIGFYAALCVGCCALGFVPISNVQRGNPCAALAWLLLAAGLGSTVIALAQAFDVWVESEWIVRGFSQRRPGSNLAQPNHLALLLAMAMASLAYLNNVSKVLGKGVSCLVFAVLATGLAATESRAGLLQVLVLAIWLCIKTVGDQARLSRWSVPIWDVPRRDMAICAGFATGLFVAYPTIFGLLTGVEGTVSRLSDGSMRFTVWPQLFDAVMLKPWLGWGVLQVAPAHNAVADAHAVAEAFHYSHNIFLDLAIWLGLPVAVGLVVLVAAWLWRHIKKTTSPHASYALALLLVLGVASLLEYQYSYAYFLAPAAFAVGVLERQHSAAIWRGLSARVALAVTLVVTGLMAWSVAEYTLLEEDVRVARFQASRIGSTPQGYTAPSTVLLTQISAVANNSRIKISPNMPPEQLTALKQSALRYPWTATQSRYAMALALNGNITEGQRQLRVMRAQHGNAVFLRVVDELNTQLQEKNSAIRFLSY